MNLAPMRIVRRLRPRRRRGFPADLALGFYLHAPERMTYLGAGRGADSFGWIVHRFVTFDGRLVRLKLPRQLRLFVWPVGKGPQPQDCIATRASIWGRIPPTSMHALGSVELGRMHELRHRYGNQPSSRR